MKLREEAGSSPRLIAYRRPDRAEQRQSSFRIVEVEDAEGLKEALAEALGIEAVVVKERRLFIWEGVRIHLDEVEGLGGFIEFEAPVPAGADLRTGEGQVRGLRDAFEIADADLVGESYCDLIANRAAAGVGSDGG